MTGTDRFDQWSATYDRASLRPLYDRAHDGVLALAGEWQLRPRRALDVGCGTGRLLSALAHRYDGCDLIGLDRSRGMLSSARPNASCHRVAFCQAAVEHLPFADRTFDLVTSTVSFRHWTDQAAGLSEIARVLVPGGPLLVAGLFGPARPSRWRPEHGLPAAIGRRALSRIGLRLRVVRHLSGFGPVPHITLVAATRH